MDIRNILNKEVKMISYYESTLESMRMDHNNSNQLETFYVSIFSRKHRLRKTVSKILFQFIYKKAMIILNKIVTKI